jgi:predicted negative regulator of RcsB-dependent stress response
MSDPKPQPIIPATAEAAPEARFEWSQSPFESFLEQHFKKLLIGLLAVGAGVGVWLVVRQQTEHKALEQAQAFTGSETLDDYKKVIANHPGTVAAGSAQLMIANLLAQNNDIAGALDELKKFSADHPRHPMTDHAAFRAAVLTAEKDGPEAGISQYEGFINQFPDSPLRPLAQMRKADALVVTGKRDDALALYESIQKDNTLYGNAVLAEAKERAAQVKLQPPTEVEFVPEPTPPPAAATDPNAPPGLSFDAPPAADAPTVTLDPPAPAPVLEPAAATPEPAPETPASETPAAPAGQ